MKGLKRSRRDCVLGGVCGGIAEYLGISSFLVRILMIIFGVTLFAYFIMWILMPLEDKYRYDN